MIIAVCESEKTIDASIATVTAIVTMCSRKAKRTHLTCAR